MCDFFSAISNGSGKVLFFTLEQIMEIEKAGNPNNYESWNSHTSIAHYFGITGSEEDKWNKWEYDCEKKELVADSLNTTNDLELVKMAIEKYLAENNAIYCKKIYNRNTGNWNSGDWNSGNRNIGNRNSGDWNTGDWNSGSRNSGDWNSGNGNSGSRNSGDWNSGSGGRCFLNTNQPVIIFNKSTDVNVKNIKFPKYFYFNLTEWINSVNMNEEEKIAHPYHKTTGGYLKKYEYKEAWQKSFRDASKEDVALTLELPNFDYAIFEEISGISKEMIDEKLK